MKKQKTLVMSPIWNFYSEPIWNMVRRDVELDSKTEVM